MSSESALWPPDGRGRASSAGRAEAPTHGRGAGHVGELAVTAQAHSGRSFPESRQDGECCASVRLCAPIRRHPSSGRAAEAGVRLHGCGSLQHASGTATYVGAGRACCGAGRPGRGKPGPARVSQPSPRNPDPLVPPWGVRELLCPCVLPYPGGCSAVFDGSLGPGDPAATAGSGSWAPSHPVPGLLRRKWSRRRSGPSASSPTAAWTWTNYWTCPSKREPGEGWPREGALRPYTECRRVVGMRGGKT